MDAKVYLTLRELHLKSGISVVTLRRYIKRGLLPFIQLGPCHLIRVPTDALEVLQAGRHGADAPSDTKRVKAKRPIPGPEPRWQTGQHSPTNKRPEAL